MARSFDRVDVAEFRARFNEAYPGFMEALGGINRFTQERELLLRLEEEARFLISTEDGSSAEAAAYLHIMKALDDLDKVRKGEADGRA
jgi:hypothetical protein